MTDTTKRRISAKEILSDIHSGMDRNGLKRKYEMSDKALESALKKLSASGSLSETDLTALRRETEAGDAPCAGWRCPACNTPQAAEMTECPACGIIVAKYIAARDKTDDGLGKSSANLGSDAPGRPNNGASVLVSVVTIIIVGVFVVAWSVHRSNQKIKTAKLNKPQFRSAQQFSQAPTPVEETPSEEQSMSIEQSATGPEAPEATPLTPFPEETTTLKPEDVPLAPPRVEPAPPKPLDQPAQYTTGTLRQFTSADFKREVVEASKTYPVIFQFYRDT
jgi:hypothetical protein